MTRVLPVVLLVALLGGAFLAVSPQARHQWAVSTQRQPASYVELAFTDTDDARACKAHDGQLRLGVSVRSHLATPESLAVRVVSTSARGQVGHSWNRVATRPGTTADAEQEVTVPQGRAYDVEVRISGRSEQLRLHCGSAA